MLSSLSYAMQPVPLDPSGLVKTRTHEQSCLNFFEIAVKKRTLALIVILCLQAPILYYLYTTEMSHYWKDKHESSYSESRDISNVIRTATDGTSKCNNVTCISQDPITPDVVEDFFRTKTITEDELSKVNPDSGVLSTENLLSSVVSETLKQIVVSDASAQEGKLPVDSINVTLITNDHPQIAENTEDKTDVGKEEMIDEDRNYEVDDEFQGENPADETGQVLPPCPEVPPGLQGRIDVSFADDPQKMKEIEEDNPLVSHGGYFKPPFCVARSKVAIIIPFRDREEHLRYFLQYMHPTLQRQQLEYRVYIINQFGKGKFNRAKLMNIGYAESIQDVDFGCFVFHDVDLILENDNTVYSCPQRPRHLSVGVDKFNYQLPYAGIFGGVTELTKDQFEKVNGYSNKFWGWGGEDDDMYNRIRISGMNIMRYPASISKYRMISHQREVGNEENPQRFDLIRKTGKTMHDDGLNSLNYKLISREEHPLYTNVTVDVLGSK